jgi:hypothetical protein
LETFALSPWKYFQGERAVRRMGVYQLVNGLISYGFSLTGIIADNPALAQIPFLE